MSDHFECAVCHQVFRKAWSDQEALNDSREMFGELDPDDTDTVCDPCFQKMLGRLEQASDN